MTSCFSAREEPKPTSVEAPIPGPVIAPKLGKDPNLLRVVKLTTQADQILREAWWVVAGERRTALRSAFGKVHRAALSAMDERLASKGIFRCDRYLFKSRPGSEWGGAFFEKCSEKEPERELASWTSEGARKARVEFVSSNLEEVLGLNVAIFGKRVSCRLSWSESEIIEELSCPGWEQDRNGQIVRLDVLSYSREGGRLLKLRGKVLENLSPVRKIEADVPLEGKIVVTETELNAPAPEPPPKPAPATAERAAVPPAAEDGQSGSPQAEAVDPDVLRARMQEMDPYSQPLPAPDFIPPPPVPPPSPDGEGR